MAYVPGFASDIFVSYAHTDDESWIRAFEKNLREELRRTLGSDVTVWQDVKNLRLGQNWQAEIVEGVKRSATFLAIVSPSYQNSDWCSEERKIFIKLFPTLEALDNSSRFLKIIKKPWDNDSHEEFLPRIQHVMFYRREQGLGEIEFLAGSDEFRLAMTRVVSGIAQILRTARRQRERVFVASPSDDCRESWEALRGELGSQSYDVQPEARRDITFSDRFLRGEMNGALLSVHLLGRTYDAFSEQQIRLAAELEQKLVFWIAASEPIDEQQRNLINLLRDGKRGDGTNLPSGWTLLPEKPPRKLIEEILSMLKPQPVAPPPVRRSSGSPSVYLLCDPTTRKDAAFALDLQRLLREKESIEAFVPQADLPTTADVVRQHQAFLRDCDGVLLYREAAPDQWLLQTVPQVLFAEKLVNRGPLLSKGLLLNDGSAFQGYPNVKVISHNARFQLSDLEPFLSPLRQAGGAHAGA